MSTEGQAIPPHYAELLDTYDLGGIQRAVALDGGMFLKPLLLETDRGRFLLRGTRFRSTLAAFGFQAQVMDAAAGRGLRCPRVLRDRAGRIGQPRDGAVWAVFEYLDGRVYSWPEWWQATAGRPGFAEDVAKQVARMHDVLAELAPDGERELSTDLPPIQFAQLAATHAAWQAAIAALAEMDIPAAPRTRDALLGVSDRVEGEWQWLQQQVDGLGIGDRPRQIVHGDVSPVNLVFSADGACGFIDWDCVHVGSRLYDALGDVVIRPPWDQKDDHRLRPEIVRRYLAAYCGTSGRRIAREELSCVPAFCLSRQLEDLRQRLSVLPQLAADRDEEYAALVAFRVDVMSQIRRTRLDEIVAI